MSSSHPATYYSLETVLYFMESQFERKDHAQYLRAAIRDDMTTVSLNSDQVYWIQS